MLVIDANVVGSAGRYSMPTNLILTTVSNEMFKNGSEFKLNIYDKDYVFIVNDISLTEDQYQYNLFLYKDYSEINKNEQFDLRDFLNVNLVPYGTLHN